MAGDGINLGNLCVAENYIRSNYYSDTYSASFEINGVTKKWDIQHIQIPFSEQKRRAYIRRFGLPDDISLETVYRRLLIATKKHLIISQKLQETDNDRIKSSSVKIIYRKTSNRDKGGKDIYIVTEPMEPIIGSEIIDSKGTDLSSVMQIGIRLLQNAKNYNDAAYHCGTVDLDSVYVVKEQSRLTVKDGFFFYASSDDDENPAEYAPDAALFMDPEVYAGKKLPSFDSDIYAVCGLIWTLLSGNNHTVKPDFGTEPKYADAQITALLQKALTERSAAYKELAKGLRDKLNSINSGKEENTYITFSSIHRDKAPDFEAISQAPEASDPEEVEKKTGLFSRFRRQKAGASEDEDDIDDDEEDDDEEEDSGSFIKTLLKKVLALFIIALTIFVLIGIFMPRSSTPEPMPTETVAPTPSPTPTPTPTPTPKPTPTPTPRPTVKPDAPSIIFDSDWAWYKSDLSPSQIGTIEFVPFLEIHEGDCKILDSWVLDGGVTCYLLSNGEAEKLGFTPSSKTGSTVLIFAGNGADMIKTNFDQGQAIEYFQKKMNSVIVNGFGVTEVDQALAAAAATPSPSISPSPTPVKTQQVYQYNNSGSANNNGSGASTGVAAASPTESAHEPPKLDPFTVSPMSIELYVGGTYPVKMSYSSAVYYSITGVCEMTSGVNGEPVILGLAPGTCIVTFMCQDSTAGEYNGQTISITVTVLGDNSGSEFNTPGEENEPILPDIPSVDEDASILPEIPGLD